MKKNRPMVDIGIDYDDYLRKKDDDMDTFLDEQEFFDIAEEIKREEKSTLAPSAGILGKSFHPDADDILNPLIEASKQRAQLDNSCAILAASITYIGMTSLLILYMIYGLRTFWADENYSSFLLVSWFVQFMFSTFISSYFIAKIEFDRYIRSLEDIYEDLQYERSMDYYPAKNKDKEPEAEPASDEERIPSPLQVEQVKDDKSNILGEYVDYESELKKNMSSLEVIAKLEKYAD
ncbi:unnamed protein product [Oikopleura dioica]|uniref:Uncharacterized protein n=1 Tax=Oikopleura dioica TaxID=34765 RepID=E4WVC6_OIKDI|nr:unnamed protein product [Oikopleura dioica]CBY35921.1 unnamed protein product [Oikopleura dioica]